MKVTIAFSFFALAALGCKKENISSLGDTIVDQNTNQRTQVTSSSAYEPGEDIMDNTSNYQEHAVSDYEDGNEYLDYNHVNGSYGAYLQYYVGKIEIRAPYRKRKLAIHAIIPFQWEMNWAKGRIHKIGPLTGFSSGTTPDILFEGTKGEIGAVSSYGGVNPATAGLYATTVKTDGSLSYNVEERRTIVFTSNGEVMIHAGFQASVLSAGTEVSTGITITRSKNESGIHSGDVTFSIESNAGTYTRYRVTPVFQKKIEIKGAFYGTIQD